MLRVFRLIRALRPLRVINRAPGLKLVVQTLLSSLKPISNIVIICCAFFLIFGILGVQLFKGMFFYCDGPGVGAQNITTKMECLQVLEGFCSISWYHHLIFSVSTKQMAEPKVQL